MVGFVDEGQAQVIKGWKSRNKSSVERRTRLTGGAPGLPCVVIYQHPLRWGVLQPVGK
jgi:hypothetical protein